MASKNPQAQAISNNMVFIRDNVAVGGLSTVAAYLLQEGLIAQQNFDDALAVCGKGPHHQASELLRPVQEKIKGDPDKFFPKFIAALRSSGLEFVADKLERAVEELPPGPVPEPVPKPPTLTVAEKPKYPIEQINALAKEYKPLSVPAEEDKKEALKAFADKVEVVIQCCNERELYAVLEKTKAPQLGTEISFEKSVRFPHRKFIAVGTFACKKVAVIRTDQGDACREPLVEALGIFKNAKFLLGLGVCAGFNNKLGDVLVGVEIEAAYNTKQSDEFGDDIIPRGERKKAADSVRDAFRDAAGWDSFPCTADDSRTAKVVFGCIYSSSILLNKKKTSEALKKKGYIGLEMEGWVMFTTIREKFPNVASMIIKGISDLADGTKSDDWQLTAAKAAVDYAHFKLEDAYFD